MATFTTVGGYAVLAVVVGGVYYLSSTRRSSKAPRTKTPAKQQPKVTEKQRSKPKNASKGEKGAAPSSDKDVSRSEKGSKKKEKQPDPDWSAMATQGSSDREDEMNNREFARQLSSAKSGTLLPSKTQDSGRQKSVKQSKAQEKALVVETSSEATAPSSAAGGDADDDRSSFNSPELEPTSIDSPVTNGGISDMLEAPPAGPSTLRITSPTNSTQPKKAKAPAASAPTETKKQRQNRRKAEEKKIAREEDEKERKVLAEKQRRTAREAEGRAAKDGSTFMAAKAPSSSAWTGPPPATTNSVKDASPPKVDLLDTYESSEAASKKESNSESDWQKVAASMSEGEQLRAFADDHWEPVQGKKSKKKGKTTQSPPPQEQQDYAPPNVIPPTKAGHEWKATLVKEHPETRERTEYEQDLKDSEWDVAPYDN